MHGLRPRYRAAQRQALENMKQAWGLGSPLNFKSELIRINSETESRLAQTKAQLV